MGSDRTFVTEVVTGLGMLGDDLDALLARRPAELANVTPLEWERLVALSERGDFRGEFEESFANGRAFFEAADALCGRRPRIVEWTGERHPPGDEVVPSDLRIDHVYLVSCKYLSKILHNPSPARLVDGLLSQQPIDNSLDWYQRIAPVELEELYQSCRRAFDGERFAEKVVDLTSPERKRLAALLRHAWPSAARQPYARLCHAVAERTAQRWSANIANGAEQMLWRLLRIGSAPYFILGSGKDGSMRLRIDTPWDWRRRFKLVSFEVLAQAGGQPRVSWSALLNDDANGAKRRVEGHVEIRWSHGRFAQPPEAKVYLDTAHHEVPGYHELSASPAWQAEEPLRMFHLD